MRILPATIISLTAGIVLVGYSLWALASGQIISTWMQTAYRPSIIYWVTVLAFLLLGMANVVVSLIGSKVDKH